VGVYRDCQIFWVPPIISGTDKATNFKFCMRILSIDRNKSPLQISGKVAGGVLRGLSKLFRAPIYWAHRAVVFAIARLSCYAILFINVSINLVLKVPLDTSQSTSQPSPVCRACFIRFVWQWFCASLWLLMILDVSNFTQTADFFSHCELLITDLTDCKCVV